MTADDAEREVGYPSGDSVRERLLNRLREARDEARDAAVAWLLIGAPIAVLVLIGIFVPWGWTLGAACFVGFGVLLWREEGGGVTTWAVHDELGWRDVIGALGVAWLVAVVATAVFAPGAVGWPAAVYLAASAAAVLWALLAWLFGRPVRRWRESRRQRRLVAELERELGVRLR